MNARRGWYKEAGLKLTERCSRMDCADRKDAVICGIDPGLGVTGYAVMRVSGGLSLVDAGVCRLDESLSLALRLVDLERDLSAILSEHRPSVVAVESLYSHYKHPRTAILMGHARGVIIQTAAKRAIEVRDYAATRVKRYLTGNGRATKSQVQGAVQTALDLPELPEPADVADAIAIAMCCAAEMGQMTPAGVMR